MIKFRIENNLLILIYDSGSTGWVFHVLKEVELVTIKKTFSFTVKDLYNRNIEEMTVDDYDGPIEFILGKLENNYYKIERNKLNIDVDLYIYKNIELTPGFFTAARDISIFKKINKLINNNIYIGGDHVDSIPKEEFEKLLASFPNSYELTKYTNARLGSILKNYFNMKKDNEREYNAYMNKKKSREGEDIYDKFQESELVKYQAIHNKLLEMLDNEVGYNEHQWQKEMLQIILLLYPKYIYVFEKTPVRDDYTKKTRELDFLLVDTEGHIDIVEIKKPFDNCIITKGRYRDNFIPLRELSGTIMQIEKYILNLNRWGETGEKFLTNKYKNKLLSNFKIKITNPSGFVIMGRDNNLNKEQRMDFEVVKRKYKNIIDILTYDDLIRRVNFVISNLQKIDK